MYIKKQIYASKLELKISIMKLSREKNFAKKFGFDLS